METRANHIWVGAVTLALLLGLALFTIWLSQVGGGQQKEFDIFFKQSVNGLAEGSGVSFSGVPSGQVQEISLWQKDPEFVRVRIAVKESVPVLQGTVATIQGVGFTGVSEIQLNGALKNAPPIREPGPEGVPVIPTKPGALGELLNNAPLLIERLSTLTERLTILLSDKNQESIESILANTNRLTAELAKQSPKIGATMTELQSTLDSAGNTLDEISKLTSTTNKLLNAEGKPLVNDLRNTLAKAATSMEELSQTLDTAQPGIERINTSTLPQTEALMRELRAMTASLTAVSEKLDQQGAGALLGGSPLPDYEP